MVTGNTSWAEIVGASQQSKETALEARALASATEMLRLSFASSQDLSTQVQNYLNRRWLALAHAEQGVIPGEDSKSREYRLLASLAQRQLLQQLSAELFTTPELLQPKKVGMPSAAAETSR